MMGEINTRVVRRSDALFAAQGSGYGPGFVYQEYFGARGALTAHAIRSAMAWGQKVVRSRLGRALLGRLGPQPGQGPSEEAMDGGFAKSQFFGVGSGGSEVEAEIRVRAIPEIA